MRYYLIAGEASGDLHASLLMGALKAKDPTAEFRYWGGEKMEAVAPGKVRDYRDTAVMGIVEVLAKAGRIRRNLEFCKADILQFRRRNTDRLPRLQPENSPVRTRKRAQGVLLHRPQSVGLPRKTGRTT